MTSREQLLRIYDEWSRGDFGRGDIFDPDLESTGYGVWAEAHRHTSHGLADFRTGMAEWLSAWERPATVEAERAELVEPVTVAPEPITRGFFRRPAGPGWALVGDASHLKHPATAQGIADAVEQAIYVAEALSAPSPSLEGYEAWRDARAAEHYEWSFSWGRFPRPERADPLFAGLAADDAAGQDLRDSFSRLVEPSAVMAKERLARWFAGAPA